MLPRLVARLAEWIEGIWRLHNQISMRMMRVWRLVYENDGNIVGEGMREKETQQRISSETKHCVVSVECGSLEQTTPKRGTK